MSEITLSTFVLAVRDLETSRRFYINQLGFEEDLAVEGWSFLRRGACRLRIGLCPDAMLAPDGGDHAWFAYLQVSDAQALHDEFAATGVRFWHPLQDKPWGMREFAILTPDGHKIVFGQDLEAGPD